MWWHREEPPSRVTNYAKKAVLGKQLVYIERGENKI